jgi:hypothetical protein
MTVSDLAGLCWHLVSSDGVAMVFGAYLCFQGVRSL